MRLYPLQQTVKTTEKNKLKMYLEIGNIILKAEIIGDLCSGPKTKLFVTTELNMAHHLNIDV